MMQNILNIYSDVNAFEACEYNELCSYHWEAEKPYRPKTYFKIGVVDGVLTVALKCYESTPRAVYTKRDEPIYQDSCLEFFVAPVEGRNEYINVECNANGAFLCEFGAGKLDRRLVSSISASSPEVIPFSGKDSNGAFWGVTVKLTRCFLSEVYGVSEKDIPLNKIKANFYKCGDRCEIPHYLAYSSVTDLPPGFHNPECFAEFKMK